MHLLENGYKPGKSLYCIATGHWGFLSSFTLKDLGVPYEVRGAGDIWQGMVAKLVVGSLYYLRDGESAEADGTAGR